MFQGVVDIFELVLSAKASSFFFVFLLTFFFIICTKTILTSLSKMYMLNFLLHIALSYLFIEDSIVGVKIIFGLCL